MPSALRLPGPIRKSSPVLRTWIPKTSSVPCREGPQVDDESDITVRRDPSARAYRLEQPQLARESRARRHDLDLDVVARREELAAEDRCGRDGLRLPEERRRHEHREEGDDAAGSRPVDAWATMMS